MKIKKISEKEIWENFLLGCQDKTFLQSWNWGEFQKQMGNKIWRLGIYLSSEAPSLQEAKEDETHDLISLALIIKIVAKRGTFLFLPHAPSVAFLSAEASAEAEAKEGGPKTRYEALKILLEELKKIAKEEKASFIRVSPVWERNEENVKVFQKSGFRKAPIHMHPELTWELDINTSEEELLAKMRKTTRYLIKQAQKNKDIEIYQSPAEGPASTRGEAGEARQGRQKLEDIEVFNQLYQKVARRHHFIPFSLNYLKNEFLAFSPDNQISIFLGKYKNEIISAAIVIFWQNIAFYHHGASLLKYSKIPTSYLLQWEAIKEAKKRGCSFYNFWGIAPSENKSPHRNPFGILRGKHPWAGLTLFKTGFGGYKKEYVKTQDFVLSKRYWLNYFVEKIRKSKRSF